MPLIDIANPSKRFEEHLRIENNFRIIVSGEFGIGKTFFLNNFFEDRKDEYNKIVISPVNYVVSSNEDVFELIKADIVYNLFFNHITVKKRKYKSTLEKIDLFIGEKPHHLFKFITSSFKKVNPFFEIADSFFEAFKELKTEYDKYIKDLENDLKGSDDLLGEYLSSFWDTKGNLFEQDFITQTINTTLQKIRKKSKKNVLIIDDLDRMDPEHIFRILNILSAHNNHLGQQNKFNFDHVIIVCDIDNIKKIYNHRYGEMVDFEGYIDKFYSSDIFFFSNHDAIDFYVNSLNYEANGNYEKIFLKFMFNVLTQDGLTVRKLIKLGISFPYENFVVYEQTGVKEGLPLRMDRRHFFNLGANFQVLSSDLTILRFFKMVSIIYGDFKIFYDRLEILKQKQSTTVKTADYKDLFYYLAIQKHLSSERSDKTFFTKHYEGPLNSPVRRSIVGFDHPKVNMLGYNFDLNLGWSSDVPFKGQGSYFDHLRVISENFTTNDSSTINLAEVFGILQSIISNCNRNKLLNKAGIRGLK